MFKSAYTQRVRFGIRLLLKMVEEVDVCFEMCAFKFKINSSF